MEDFIYFLLVCIGAITEQLLKLWGQFPPLSLRYLWAKKLKMKQRKSENLNECI